MPQTLAAGRPLPPARSQRQRAARYTAQAMVTPSNAASSNRRYEALDALRGVAIVWMTLFHLCYDLNHFGWIRQQMLSDPFWTTQRTLIVSLFLFCAGFGQAVTMAQAGSIAFSRRFWRRWAQVAAAALLVSVGSWWMFPASYIHFGVLHGMAVMLLLLRLLAGWRQWALLLLGAGLLLLPVAMRNAHAVWPQALAFLNGKAFNWLGLVATNPVTQDYVPVVPWLGVMCAGLVAGRWVLVQHSAWLARRWLPGPAQAALAWLGRWSLSYYLLHQPVLMGALMLLSQWVRPVT